MIELWKELGIKAKGAFELINVREAAEREVTETAAAERENEQEFEFKWLELQSRVDSSPNTKQLLKRNYRWTWACLWKSFSSQFLERKF